MDIRDFFSYFRKRIWIIALTFVLCTILSGFFTYFNKIYYLSTPKIIVGPQTVVSKDGKFVTNLVYVLSDLIENDKVAAKLSSETGLNIDKDSLKGIVSTDLNDQHQRMYFIVKSTDMDTVKKVSDKLPDIIAGTARELFNIDNLMVVKSDKIVVEGKNYKKNVVSGGVAGIGLGFLIVFMLLIYDDRLRNRKDIKKLFGIDYLGLINRPSSSKEYKEDNLSLMCTRLLLKADNMSSKIISNVSMGIKDSSENTYTISNQLSLFGKKVLAVELDNSSKALESKAVNGVKLGFSDYLTGENISCSEIVNKTGNKNLDIIPFGTQKEITISGQMNKRVLDFIGNVKNDYDMVLFNMPYNIGMEQILMFTHLCDGTVLCVKDGEVTLKQTETLIDNLRESDALLLGYSVAV